MSNLCMVTTAGLRSFFLEGAAGGTCTDSSFTFAGLVTSLAATS